MHFNYDAARLTLCNYPLSSQHNPPPAAVDDIINIYNKVTNAMRRQTDKLLSYFKVQFVYNRVTIAFLPPFPHFHAPLAEGLLFSPSSSGSFPSLFFSSISAQCLCFSSHGDVLLLNVLHVSGCSFCIIKSICRSVSSATPPPSPHCPVSWNPFAVCVWSSN